MNLNRRGFLGGLLSAPVVITRPGLLMRVKSLILPPRALAPFALFPYVGLYSNTEVLAQALLHAYTDPNWRERMLPSEHDRIGEIAGRFQMITFDIPLV